MTLGLAERQGDLLDDVTRFCDEILAPASVYSLLHRERDALFPDEFFADLFSDRGRRSVPPSVVATVMVLQRLDGLSDREAVERYSYDARWRYAAGVGGYDTGGWGGFAHTVLVDMRERLRRSARPDRVFEVALEAARSAGLVGRRRVMDSTPLYDAVATMDTVTLIRSAIRSLLAVAGGGLEVELRGVLASGDDYATSAKPQIDWGDQAARDELIDSRAKDAFACLALLDGRDLDAAVDQAARLVATVVGQDLEEGDDGVFRIARRVAPDRVISTVDPEARHGHKTASRGFDGYKGHAGVDPDSEIITATLVTPGNVGDAAAAEDLIADLLDESDADPGDAAASCDADPGDAAASCDADPGDAAASCDADPGDAAASCDDDDGDDDVDGEHVDGEGPRVWLPADYADIFAEDDDEAEATERAEEATGDDGPTVYGDAAYGTGQFQSRLEEAGIASGCKTQLPVAAGGRYPKNRFAIDLEAGTVTCPNNVTVTISPRRDGAGGTASFADACATCPLRAQCSESPGGRTIRIGPHEAALTRARTRQADPAWKADYRATRPKVERKLAHLMRRKHGGRRARVRGTERIDADFRLLAAAANLARLAVLGLHSTGTGWAAATA